MADVRLSVPITREALAAAIQTAQVGARARLVDPDDLARRVLEDWALVERQAAALGVSTRALHPHGSWWDRVSTDDHSPTVTTVVTVSSDTWCVLRKNPSVGEAPGLVRMALRGTEIRAAAPVERQAEQAPIGAHAADLVTRLRAQVAHLVTRLRAQVAHLVARAEEVREGLDPVDPQRDPEDARDAIEQALRVLEHLVDDRRCPGCGCTDFSPCAEVGGASCCGWAAGGLCTACSHLPAALLTDAAAEVTP